MPAERLILGLDLASRLARLALACIQQEYPHKLDHVIDRDGLVPTPRSLHPAFYGCFDWHSAVHGHWMLVRLLKLFPTLPESSEIRERLGQNLSFDNIRSEVLYLQQPDRLSFERTYGWAWLLKLAQELWSWRDSDGETWSRNLEPLAAAFARRFIEFLPKQDYPIRNGLHSNTAFGLSFAWDYANSVGHFTLKGVVEERGMAYFADDTDCPAAWEPSSEDFLSPSLTEADLMCRLMAPRDFRAWLHRFLPGLDDGLPHALLRPVAVADRSDGRIVHLDGLNLSRAWCMQRIAMRLPADDPSRIFLERAARMHAADGIGHVASGDYAGEHWLASFAVYMFSAWE